MNIKHLQYMIEIERVGSISQAAKNLYVGQPNLSRILREVEDSVGFTIFDRTHQGIRPTERGMAFLQHAHNILLTAFLSRTLTLRSRWTQQLA